MAEKALVLSADPWSLVDKVTGEVKNGVSCWFVNQYRDGEFGQKPTKLSITDEVASVLKGKLPAVCDLEYGSRPGAQSKAALTVVGAKVLRAVDLSTFFNAPAPTSKAA